MFFLWCNLNLSEALKSFFFFFFGIICGKVALQSPTMSLVSLLLDFKTFNSCLLVSWISIEQKLIGFSPPSPVFSVAECQPGFGDG